MMTSFSDSFKSKQNLNKNVPDEVVEVLKKELPKGFNYTKDEKGNYRILPSTDKISMTFNFNIDYDRFDSNKIKLIKNENILAYLYRSQKRVPIKNVRVGDQDKDLGLDDIDGNPLTGLKSEVKGCYLIPSKFPDPIPIKLEDTDGDKRLVEFQQAALDSLTEVLFTNINFPALKIKIYIYSPLTEIIDTSENSKTSKSRPVCINYTVSASKAENVDDALCALNFMKNIIDGKLKMNNEEIDDYSDANYDFDLEWLDKQIELWSKIKLLENNLGLHFNPKAEREPDEDETFYQLDLCINNDKSIVYKHPFNSLHVNNFKVYEEQSTTDILNPDANLGLKLYEGPIEFKFLGTTFQLYRISFLSNFIITDIEWDDEKKRGCTLYIDDANDKTIEFSIKYMTKEKFEEVKDNG